jgi:hypothetical protein
VGCSQEGGPILLRFLQLSDWIIGNPDFDADIALRVEVAFNYQIETQHWLHGFWAMVSIVSYPAPGNSKIFID